MKAHTLETQSTMTPQKALAFLKEGNERFVSNLKVNRNLLQQANDTRDGQFPFAAVVSCMDSRTSAELVFDQGLGDIFSIRIAGNIINPDIVGSLEYAGAAVGVKLLVVMGHSKCGAVKGACDHVELGNLTGLLDKIQPAVSAETETSDADARNSKNAIFVENVAKLNVKQGIQTILETSPTLRGLIESGKLGIVGGKHDLDTGVVEFYEDTLVA